MECVHRFQVDSHNIGTCSLCGEVRQFPYDKGEPVKVLKKGNPNKGKEETMSKGLEERRARVGSKQNYERHCYYEYNKENIIADLLSTGRAATREKWGISLSSLHNLEKRWLTEEQKLKIPQVFSDTPESPHPSTNSTPSNSSNGQLPPFPPFSDKWEPEVQLQWFEVYRELATKEKSTVATTS
jgi:hypothetical protein